jgi:pyruvate formate lyase activating enzyme
MDDLTRQSVGNLIEINRGSTHDGPGMRTTVFFKGCTLHCAWCQNPEGIDFGQDVWWEGRKCIHCLSCVEACPNFAISAHDDRLSIDRERCGGTYGVPCGGADGVPCVEACPSRAMSFTGEEWSLSRLVREVLKDREYYAAFGGGVTASGGEPLGQYPFVAEFFRILQGEGIHTALDTCGHVPFEAFEAVLPYTDHVLYDLKIADPELHRLHTGKSNRVILDNLLRLTDRYLRPSQGRMKLWIRTPLIPGASANAENITAIGRFIQEYLSDQVERWELCAFNNACNMKYQKLGLQWPFENTGLMTQDQVDQIRTAALSSRFQPDKLVISGLVAREAPLPVTA